MAKLMAGLFGHESDASLAVEALKEAGVDTKRIAVVSKHKLAVNEIARENELGEAEEGLASEGLFGTAKALAAALDLEPERVSAAGGGAARLAGAWIGGAKGEDGVSVTLIGMGIPEEDAKRYAEQVEHGRILVLAELKEREQSGAEAAFAQHGALPLE